MNPQSPIRQQPQQLFQGQPQQRPQPQRPRTTSPPPRGQGQRRSMPYPFGVNPQQTPFNQQYFRQYAGARPSFYGGQSPYQQRPQYYPQQQGAASGGSKRSFGWFGAIALLALYAFNVLMGLRSTRGSVCGRGWTSFLLLPIVAGVGYTLLKRTFSSASQESYGAGDVYGAYQGLRNVRGSFQSALKAGGSKGLGRALSVTSDASSFLGFAVFLALCQYLLTVLFLIFQKPDVDKSTVFKRSFISAGISFFTSLAFIIAFLVVSNVVPVVRAALTIGRNLPIIGNLINENIAMSLALNPLTWIFCLAGYGIACSATNPAPAPAPAQTQGQPPK